MSRKQIVNENIQWPEIDESTSKNIVDILEASLKKYPGLKRRKNPPKRFRKNNKDKNQDSNQDNKKQDKEEKSKPIKENERKTQVLKNHIRIGINAITKTLEREPEKIMFVLVCHSCKPLAVLTRHIQLMCAMSNIPAGCVHNLSSRLKTQLNINTISALLVFKQNEDAECLDEIKKVLVDWQSRIPALLPKLKNPFTENPALSTLPSDLMISLIDEVKKEIFVDDKMNEVIVNSEMDVSDNDDEGGSDFGADFLRVERNVKYINFDHDDYDFILFNDAYEKKRKRKSIKEMDF